MNVRPDPILPATEGSKRLCFEVTAESLLQANVNIVALNIPVNCRIVFIEWDAKYNSVRFYYDAV